jgi:Protein-glutamine gamma-glutamyltransferase
LALLITGNENNWTLLSGQDSVKPEQKVNVGVLLVKLENIIREKIAFLCKQNSLNADFYELSYDQTTGQPNLLEIKVGTEGQSKVINNFFGKDSGGKIECLQAVKLIYAKAVLDVVGAEAFDGVGYNEDALPEISLKKQQISRLLLGDRAWIRNHKDYIDKFPGGAWQAENVIKVGNDKFWGFGVDSPIKSEKSWEDQLKNAYNKNLTKDKQRFDKVLGFDGEIKFLDIAKIARTIFLFKISEMEQ